MLTIDYRENGLLITEVYGTSEEHLPRSQADLIACFQLPEQEPSSTGRCLHKRFKTLYIDLQQDESALFSAIHRSTRNEIKRADREPFHEHRLRHPKAADIETFCTFYDQFAAAKQIPPVRRNKLHALVEQNALHLSFIKDDPGDILCYHAYIVDGERATSFYIASLREEPGSPRNRAISRANKYLHWLDMKAFQQDGYRLFDFGGLSLDTDRADLENVNRFKKAFGGTEVMEYKTYRANTWRGRAGLLYLSWKWRHSPEFIKMDW